MEKPVKLTYAETGIYAIKKKEFKQCVTLLPINLETMLMCMVQKVVKFT